MVNERKRVRMVNRRTGRPIPDPDTIEGIVNIVDDPIDNSPPAGIESGFSVFNPAPHGAKPKEVTMARKPKAESFVNDEGYTETVNPEIAREPTKQEIAAEKAQAKIAAKAEKLAAREAAKAEKEAAKLAKVTATKEEREAAKIERQARLAALNPDGTRKYLGSMLALADRVKEGAYVKGVTGQLRSNDELAQILDGVTPNGVIQTAKAVLELDANPYSHLNVGQQSMNLRNKLRGALRNGLTTLDAVREYVAVNDLDCSVSIVEKAAAKAERVATAKAEREAKAALKAAAHETAEA
ncbi:hypothetical protein UFOVP1544_16 [uncultured Caudovirales phage]|uniref:Coil containing protein n=1 Tax=uncultured Caudovirales phage TaxID=2100421 RepID=A0A6J7XET8_9CAUD|nr:hypothetical protein UFOVP1544_16 [uncultured Caudovirales phage]